MSPSRERIRKTASAVGSILTAMGGQSPQGPTVDDDNMARDLIRSIKKLNIAVDRLSEAVEYQNMLLEED